VEELKKMRTKREKKLLKRKNSVREEKEGGRDMEAKK
jgi:hypothetical protein